MKQLAIRASAATNIAQMEPLIPETREMTALLEIASELIGGCPLLFDFI